MLELYGHTSCADVDSFGVSNVPQLRRRGSLGTAAATIIMIGSAALCA